MSDIHHIHGVVTRDGTTEPIENAVVELLNDDDECIATTCTDESGRFSLKESLVEGGHKLRAKAFGVSSEPPTPLDVRGEQHQYDAPVNIDVKLDLRLAFSDYQRGAGTRTPTPYAAVGQEVVLTVESCGKIRDYRWPDDLAMRVIQLEERKAAVVTFRESGAIPVSVAITGDDDAKTRASTTFPVVEATRSIRFTGGNLSVDGQEASGRVKVTMERTESYRTDDEVLWKAIRERSEAISFGRYQDYIKQVLLLPADEFHGGGLSRRLGELGTRGLGAYHTLREFTELFVLKESGSIIEGAFEDAPKRFLPGPPLSGKIEHELRRYLRDGELPYINRVVKAAYPWLGSDDAGGLDNLRSRVLQGPLFLELWHEMCLEHGMLMRTMEAISARFQNIYNRGENDGLANYESSPLRALGDFFWGWINSETTRLNPRRRVQEYKHQYGPTALDGALGGVQTADVRSAFPDAFMNLIGLCEEFYKEDNQTTVIADAYPVLFGLRQVHQMLAWGMGNVAGPLTYAARVETLMSQLVLAQPEVRAFLRVREMVPYDEAWQASVDAMVDLQGWRQPTITQHNDCARFGERILLSIRLADWTAGDETTARNWLRDNREAIRRFMYAQRAVTNPEFAATTSWSAPRLHWRLTIAAAFPENRDGLKSGLARSPNSTRPGIWGNSRRDCQTAARRETDHGGMRCRLIIIIIIITVGMGALGAGAAGGVGRLLTAAAVYRGARMTATETAETCRLRPHLLKLARWSMAGVTAAIATGGAVAGITGAITTGKWRSGVAGAMTTRGGMTGAIMTGKWRGGMAGGMTTRGAMTTHGGMTGATTIGKWRDGAMTTRGAMTTGGAMTGAIMIGKWARLRFRPTTTRGIPVTGGVGSDRRGL